MVSEIVRLLCIGSLLFVRLCCSQQAASPAFDVASVKPAADQNPWHWDADPGILRLRGMNLKQCILTAYHVQDFQVEGGPGWTDSEHYDIDGKASYPAKRDEMLLMLRALLVERFHLTLQTKQRPAEGYRMTVAKSGLKIKPDTSEGSPAIQVNRATMSVTRFPMVGLAGALSNILGVPVSDDTGLAGRFDFSLEWTPDENRTVGAGLSLSLPEALEAKTGLRLEHGKVSIPVYVIEHADHPAPN